MELVNLSLIDQYWRLMIYGKAGSGKTTLTAGASLDARTAPVLHIDAGGNPISVVRTGAQPKIVRMTKLADLNYIYDWLFKGQPEDHPMVSQLGCVPGYKTLVLDGLTRIQFMSFGVAMGNTEAKPGDMPSKPEWQEYNRVLLNMTNAFVKFYDLKMHVIVTALEDAERQLYDPDKVKLKSNELDDSDYYYQAMPAIDGKSLTRVTGMAETVIRMAAKHKVEPSLVKRLEKATEKPVKHCVAQFQETRSAYAKDQHGFGVSYLSDPTITQMMDLLERKHV